MKPSLNKFMQILFYLYSTNSTKRIVTESVDVLHDIFRLVPLFKGQRSFKRFTIH